MFWTHIQMYFPSYYNEQNMFLDLKFSELFKGK